MAQPAVACKYQDDRGAARSIAKSQPKPRGREFRQRDGAFARSPAPPVRSIVRPKSERFGKRTPTLVASQRDGSALSKLEQMELWIKGVTPEPFGLRNDCFSVIRSESL